MTSKMRKGIAVTAALLCLLASGIAFADNNEESNGDSVNNGKGDRNDGRWSQRSSPCQSSARTMFRACHLEVGNDFTTTEANCFLEPTPDARAECRRTARDDLQQGRNDCRAQWGARRDACQLLGEDRYVDPITDPMLSWANPDDVGSTVDPNPYVSVKSGRTLLLRAGEDFEESVIIHVTEDIREIQGVPCRVIWDLVLLASENDAGETEYEAVEVTQDWFAQEAASGDIYYCGEAVQDYEDGIIFTLAGSFEAGTDFARGGWLTKAFPVVGDVHRQELDIGDAEDIVEYRDLAAVPTEEEGGENAAFPCAPAGCLKTFDFASLSPGSTEFKYYLAGTGIVAAVGMDDGVLSGDREELVCIGESLEVLDTPDCGLANPAAFRETICKLVPDALCE